ncbi:MBOAT family O-acyltransferase [Saccharicrinis sp. 156]|uniref:MBOAT family O-acyltransferase n=1 Tax=Saccharicrinis sp. 156 TaxID=3417574 RepID=UPI003D33876B
MILCISSFFFIGAFSLSFLVYTSLFTLLNFMVGIGMDTLKDTKRRYAYYLGQVLNIGGLVFFKYINFLVENVNVLLGGISGFEIPYADVLVPIGLSYYTFQAIGYLYTMYKTKEQAEKNLLDFTLYMFFWPKIVAGPIERHKNFLSQLKNPIEFDYTSVVTGGQLVLWGLFKKLVIGDTLGIIVSTTYNNVEHYQGVGLLLTFLIQPIQLYCDFSGYTDMALGFAKIFGVQLTDNFNRPFMARTVGEFWRRWHISLTTWCNTFIYNRVLLKHRKWGSNAIYYAIFVSFTFIGIWHGANWTFIFLGFLQVLALMYENKTKRWRSQLKYKISEPILKWGSRALVYLFFANSLVFFFAKSIRDVGYFYYNLMHLKMDTNEGGASLRNPEFYLVFFMAIFVIVRDIIDEDKIKRLQSCNVLKTNNVFRWTLYIFWIMFVVYFSKNQTNFVYMQF